MTVEQQRQAELGQQALRAFERDLPRLWEERPGQWVAYQGERRLGFGTHKHELYHQCFDQGLGRGEFVIFCIEPREPEMYLGPFLDADVRYSVSEVAQVMTAEQQRQADLGQQAMRAFESDLPRLWQERPGQWVAYQGERLLGFAAQQHELYHQCFDQGLSLGEFVTFCIEPMETEIYIDP